MVTRHEFLTALHNLLNPQVYLETGVQTGASLSLSQAPLSIGIDPHPIITPGILAPNHSVFTATSDDYFRNPEELAEKFIDFAFIDGMHLVEYALRDFANIERYSHPGTVVVFDDMLPRNQEEAARTMGAGDWTGDVWQLAEDLPHFRPDLVVMMVDTEPTGTMVVTHLSAGPNRSWEENLLSRANFVEWVPEWIIDRRHALPATVVLDLLTRWRSK